MILHVVLFRFHASTTPIEVEDARRALLSMRGAVPGVRGVSFGPNLAPSAAEWPYVLVVELPNAAAIEPYLAHPVHQDVLAKYIKPVLEARLAADAEAP